MKNKGGEKPGDTTATMTYNFNGQKKKVIWFEASRHGLFAFSSRGELKG